MFESLSAGWKVASATRRVVFQDKQLLLYPVVSGIAGAVEFAALIAILVFGSLLVPAGMTQSATSQGTSSALLYAVIFIFYVVIGFTSTYVIMAMLIAFKSYMNGKKISMLDALGQTSPYAVLILEWSVFSTTIVFIVRAIENRLGPLGQIIFGTVAAIAISAGTVFVVPIILEEKVGPIDAIRSSVNTLTKAFGQSFAGILYTDLYGMGITIIGIILIVGGVFMAASSATVSLLAMGAGGIMLVFGVLVTSVLGNTFKLILYEYTKTGSLPDGFTKEMMESAVRYRGGSNRPRQVA